MLLAGIYLIRVATKESDNTIFWIGLVFIIYAFTHMNLAIETYGTTQELSQPES